MGQFEHPMIYFEGSELSRYPVVTDFPLLYFPGLSFQHNTEEILWKGLSPSQTIGDFFQGPVFAETREEELKLLGSSFIHFRPCPVVLRASNEGQTHVEPKSLKEPTGNFRLRRLHKFRDLWFCVADMFWGAKRFCGRFLHKLV